MTQHFRYGLLSWGKITSFDLLANTLLNAAQYAVSLFCCKGTLMARIQFGIHLDSIGHLLQSYFPSEWSSMYWCLRLFRSSCKSFHFLNFRRFLSANFSSLPRALWMVARLTMQIINEDMKCDCTLYDPQGTFIHCWPPTRLYHSPLPSGSFSIVSSHLNAWVSNP